MRGFLRAGDDGAKGERPTSDNPAFGASASHVTTKVATIWVIYKWHEAKSRSNFAKHGLDFADAEQVLTGPFVTFVDSRFDYGEERLITLGLLAGRVVIIAHAPRGDDTTRIISMRKANRREQKIYQERLGEG